MRKLHLCMPRPNQTRAAFPRGKAAFKNEKAGMKTRIHFYVPFGNSVTRQSHRKGGGPRSLYPFAVVMRNGRSLFRFRENFLDKMTLKVIFLYRGSCKTRLVLQEVMQFLALRAAKRAFFNGCPYKTEVLQEPLYNMTFSIIDNTYTEIICSRLLDPPPFVNPVP